MKIIKLWLLLTFFVLAEYKLDIPDDINVTLLEDIVKNGWNDANIPVLNTFIEREIKVLPEVLKRVKMPLITATSIVENRYGTDYDIPKMLLLRMDYLYLFTYVKFLEANGKSEEALYIYLEVLKGLHNIEDKSRFGLLYRMAVEELVTGSLRQGITTNIFSFKQKNKLKKYLQDLLLLNHNRLCEVIQHNNIWLVGTIRNMPDTNEKLKEIVSARVQDFNKGYSKEFCSLENKKDILYFEKRFDKAKREVLDTYNKWQNKQSDREDKIVDIPKLLSSVFFALDINGNTRVKLDLLEQIELNEKLLNTL